MTRVRGLCLAVLATAALVVAAWAGPRPAAVAAVLRDPQGWVDSVGADAAVVAVVGLLCWAALVWLAGALALVACSALPGALGRCADVLAERVVPGAVRRVATVLVGVSVTASPVAATGVAAAGDTRPPDAAAATDVDWPHAQVIEHGSPPPNAGAAPDDPRAHATEHGSPPPNAGAAPGDRPHAHATEHGSPPPNAGAAPVDWPLATEPSAPAGPTARPGHSHAPSPSAVPAPSSRARPAEASSGADPADPRRAGQTHEADRGSGSGATERRPGRSAETDDHVVAAGDSLWLIAARRLAANGAEVADAATAVEWPRWYAANADLIGPDPDLIHPGQRLVAPSDSRSSHDVPTVPPGGP